MFDFAAKFSAGLSYADFLKTHGSDEHRRRWAELHGRVKLTADQPQLVASFQREMKVLCLAGAGAAIASINARSSIISRPRQRPDPGCAISTATRTRTWRAS